SLLLLVAAGLFGRTVSKLHSIQLGFAREDVLLFNVHPRSAGYDDAAFNRFYEELRGRLSEVAGIRSVSFSRAPFPSGGGSMAPACIAGAEAPANMFVSGRLPVGERPPNMAAIFSVGPSFFDTMQMTRVAGRDFTSRDTAGAPQVVIINERLARV